MSQATDTSALWFGPDGPGPARERVRKAVAALTRARHLQIIVDHAFGGLCIGLCLATLAVLVLRLTALPYAAWQLAGISIVGAVAVALVLGLLRRPDPLDVAIRADMRLRLKQRLSTAWEFMTLNGDDTQTDRLAVHAVRARLPARAAMVFPLRINRWGRLAPLAATALLLASVVDLSEVRGPMPGAIDELVVEEGRRLSAFGRDMQARAQRDKLPRSNRQAEQLERLGAQMESGKLNRDQALGPLARMGEALDQERLQALAEVDPKLRGQSGGRAGRSPLASDLDPGAMLERMQRDALSSDDARALTRRLDDLERSGIPRKAVQDALARHDAGVDDALREILEKLMRFQRALKEDDELSNALAMVRRAHDNLSGNSFAPGGQGAPASTHWDDEEGDSRDDKGTVSEHPGDRSDSRSKGTSARTASEADTSAATERADAPVGQRTEPPGRVLRPQGQMREGEEFTAPGRMLPRANRPNVENVTMGSEYSAQAEAVLSREHYPAHIKEFVRRYFLHLSQGARDPTPQPPASEAKRE